MITIGLDVGTTTISGVVYDSGEEKVLGTRTVANASKVRTEKTWEDLQDADIALEICESLLEGFKQQFPDIRGIGLAGQMHGTLYVNAQGRAASAIATWQDARGELPCKDGKTYAERLSELTGFRMSTGFGLTTHFYNLHNGLVPPDAVSMCIVEDYVGMRLAGRKKPLVHASNAHSMGAFDLKRMDFDNDAISKAGMNPGILPEVAEGETLIGETDDGIPVCTAIGDNQAAFIGAVREDSNVLANIGTGSQISVRSKKLVEAEGLDVRPFVDGEFLLVGASLCGGSAYALLQDLFKEVLGLYGVEAEDDLYAKMEGAAREVIDTENPLEVDTRFRGTRMLPEVRGAIKGIEMDNLTAGQLALGMMQGICDELYGFYQLVPEVLRNAEVLVASGNAVRLNATLRVLLEKRFQMALRLSPFHEEGALGAAMLAARLLA